MTQVEAKKNYAPHAQKPTGPSFLKTLLNLPSVIKNPLQFLEKAATYGDLVRIAPGIVLVNRPDYIEKILVGTNRTFIKGMTKPQPASGPASGKGLGVIGNGLVVSEGELWLRQRRLIQPAFHRQQIATYGAIMVACTKKNSSRWQVGQTLDLQKELMQLTLQIAARCLFNVDITAGQDAIAVVTKQAMEALTDPALMLPLPTKRRREHQLALAELDKLLYKLIADRRAQSSAESEASHDLLTMLVQARDEDGSQMSPKLIRDELLTMIIAGHETTALTLTWLVYLLSQHPAVAAKLKAELQSVLGDRLPTVADVNRLPYLEATIKETLRYYPVTWGLARVVNQPTTLDGYKLKKGSRVVVSPWLMHRDERFWQAATKFQPERWLSHESDQLSLEKSLPKFAYLPFGGGPRVCIGEPFARLEAIMVAATLLQRYNFEPAPGQAAPMEFKVGVTLRPKNGLPVVVRAN